MADVWITNAGAGLVDGTSLANAYAADNLAAAIDDLSVASAVSVLRICGDLTITTAQTTAGIVDSTSYLTAVKKIIGRNAGDTANAHVVLSTTLTAGAMLTLGNDGIYGTVWNDITFSGGGNASTTPLNWSNSNTWPGQRFNRCNFIDGYDGCYARSTGTHTFFQCVFKGNSNHGLTGPGSRGSSVCVNCIFADNGASGALTNVGGYRFVNCVFAHNGDDGITFNRYLNIQSVVQCTFDNNGRHGIYVDFNASSSNAYFTELPILMNNIITNNGGYGLKFQYDDPSSIGWTEDLMHVAGNYMYGNTSGAYDAAGTYEPAGLDAYIADNNELAGSDPGFTDNVLAGGLDYSISTSSPVIGAGFPINVTDTLNS